MIYNRKVIPRLCACHICDKQAVFLLDSSDGQEPDHQRRNDGCFDLCSELPICLATNGVGVTGEVRVTRGPDEWAPVDAPEVWAKSHDERRADCDSPGRYQRDQLDSSVHDLAVRPSPDALIHKQGLVVL